MPSFFIPLSGLEADNTALNTIANNLSNMNTVAYKSQDVQFSDLFYQEVGSSGSGDPEQVGAGTKVGAISTDFSSGTATPSTGNPQDVALNGDGFFVVQSGTGQEYTRTGNFVLSSDGHLLTQAGQEVMGYSATNGVVNTNSPLAAIQIPVGQVEQPQATNSMSVTANLDPSATAGAPVQGQQTVYDSLGESHLATVSFSKSATPANTWTYTVSIPASDVTAAGAAAGTNTATGTLVFNPDGSLASINGTAVSPTGNPNPTITFSDLADGANNLSFTLSLYNNGNSTVDQVASSSTSAGSIGSSAIAGITQNGYEAGQYTGFSVDSSGIISASFSNGQSQTIGQLAVASVTNEQGLTKLGDGNYQTTLASGQATVGTAGVGGRGTIEDDALEGSNVDVSTEFSNLIVAQRAFEANAKSITTFDTVTQDTINMIH